MRKLALACINFRLPGDPAHLSAIISPARDLVFKRDEVPLAIGVRNLQNQTRSLAQV